MDRTVVDGIAELARQFTKGRAEATSRYLQDPALLSAYCAYYRPVNAAKVRVLLDELPLDWTADASGRALEVLDLGSGPGTGVLGLSEWLTEHAPDQAVRITAVDHEPEALAACVRLWRGRPAAARAGFSLTTKRLDLERNVAGRLDGRQFDLIIVANVLNEVFRGARDPIRRRADLLARVLESLAPSGTLMIIEPALRETARALHEVRNAVLERKLCTVYSPCLHDAPCPALIKPTDWCHEERPWNAPDTIRALDEQVGLIKDALKFSYLLLRTDGRTIVPRSPQLYRVVSELREMKGEKRAWLCAEHGRPEAGRLYRQHVPANAAFDRAHRGAIIRIDGLGDGLVARIGSESVVELIRSV